MKLKCMVDICKISLSVQKQNVNGMSLVEGKGNMPGQLKEGDKMNTIYVLVKPLSWMPSAHSRVWPYPYQLASRTRKNINRTSTPNIFERLIFAFIEHFCCLQDSNAANFYKAEQYHQFHNGIGVPFGPEYTKKQKQVAQRTKRIGPTGCPEVADFFG